MIHVSLRLNQRRHALAHRSVQLLLRREGLVVAEDVGAGAAHDSRKRGLALEERCGDLVGVRLLTQQQLQAVDGERVRRRVQRRPVVDVRRIDAGVVCCSEVRGK